MKKITILFLTAAAAILAGCSGEINIACSNQTANVLLVTDAVNAQIEPGKSKEFRIKNNSCLEFQEIKLHPETPDTPIEYLKDTPVTGWKYYHGRRCFDQSNSYTFYTQP